MSYIMSGLEEERDIGQHTYEEVWYGRHFQGLLSTRPNDIEKRVRTIEYGPCRVSWKLDYLENQLAD